MAKRKKDKIEDLVGQLIWHELEAQLFRMVTKAKKKAFREANKLNEVLRLEYHRNEGFEIHEAEVIEPLEEENQEVKKTEPGTEG